MWERQKKAVRKIIGCVLKGQGSEPYVECDGYYGMLMFQCKETGDLYEIKRLAIMDPKGDNCPDWKLKNLVVTLSNPKSAVKLEG